MHMYGILLLTQCSSQWKALVTFIVRQLDQSIWWYFRKGLSTIIAKLTSLCFLPTSTHTASPAGSNANSTLPDTSSFLAVTILRLDQLLTQSLNYYVLLMIFTVKL
jgi:hypothetical protein